MKDKPKNPKKCLNPSCGKEFIPGHYGDKQKVCTGKYTEECRRCPAKQGRECKKCNGGGKFEQECKAWYRGYWAQVRKPPRGLPNDIFNKIKESISDPVKLALIIVARETGLRKGELLGLTWFDVVDHDGGIKNAVEVRGQWSDKDGFKPTKTHASRLGMFSDEARESIKKLEKGKPEERIFPFWESAIYNWFVSLQVKLGIANPETGGQYRFHDLRHSLGSELVRGGRADLAQKLLGHKNLNTTMGYSQQSADEILDDVKKLRKNKNKLEAKPEDVKAPEPEPAKEEVKPEESSEKGA